MTRIVTYLLLLTLVASTLAGVAGATAPNPTYGTAVVDGSIGEWNLGSDFFANMYRAGNPAKPLESKAYLRYDCATGTVYVLVLSQSGVPVLAQGYETDAWTKVIGENGVKYDGNSGDDGTPPDFRWVGLSQDGKTAEGYEASYHMPTGSHKIVIHVEVNDDAAAQTSATTGFPKDGMDLVLDCGTPTESPTPTQTPEVTVTETPTVTATPTETVLPIVGSISGAKWHDANGNGLWDSSEEGLSGWTISLEVQGDGSAWVPAGQTTTDANGAYSFTDLAPGHYRVGEELQTGWTQTYPAENAGMHDLVISAEQATYGERNFGNMNFDDGGGGTETPTSTPTQTPEVTVTETPTVTETVTEIPTQTVTETPTIDDGGEGTSTPTPTPTETTVATTETTFPAGGGATDTPTPTPTTSAPTTAPTTTVTTQPTIDDGGEGTTVPTTAPTTAVPTTTVPTTVAPTPTPTIEPDLCPLDPVPTGPVTAIAGPTEITEPGFYRIGTDAVNATVPVWLEVNASNVTIDGMGHTIDGVDEDGTYGIRVRGDGPLENITIQNLTVTDFAYGIGLFETSHSRIVRVSATSNTYDGIMVVGGGDNRIECSVIDRDDDGINMTATNRTVVANNIVTGNVRGSGIHLSQGCDEVALLGNIVGENDEGIEVQDAVNSTIQANRIYSSRYYGLNLTTAGNLTVVDNYFNNRVNVRTPTGPFTGVWSLEALAATNVVGNSFIGGNYWGTPEGTGYSDVTPDWDGDGFVNGIYVLPGQIGVDHLPLAPSSSLLTYTAVPASAAIIGPLSSTEPSLVTAAPDPWAGWRKTYPIGDGLGL